MDKVTLTHSVLPALLSCCPTCPAACCASLPSTACHVARPALLPPLLPCCPSFLAALLPALLLRNLSCCCSLLSLTPFPGPLPPSFGDLVEPTEFDFSLNFATGQLPESWSKLTSLKIL
jgi:hypothetical protein